MDLPRGINKEERVSRGFFILCLILMLAVLIAAVVTAILDYPMEVPKREPLTVGDPVEKAVVKQCALCNRDWRKRADSDPWELEWDYVCTVTGRIDDAQITKGHEELTYKVWVRGAGYGEFDTVEHAKRYAVHIVTYRNLSCPD